eukprot:1862975-Rhodomonas_salina.3
MSGMGLRCPRLCMLLAIGHKTPGTEFGYSATSFPKEYMESSVPERRGPLKQGEDGKSEYGVKISAGSHKMAQNIRGGSKWVSEKMVEGTKHLSEKLGPAASQVRPISKKRN